MIETRDLSKSFVVRGSVVEAVAALDLEVEAGEIFGFLGPNGAGKTTTLRMLATLLPPTGGEAMVAGYDLMREPARVRDRIGYVGQAGGADRGATGREDLTLQGRLYGLDRGRVRERVEKLISALELESFADRVVNTYSGGQRRRLDLALGLVHEPPLLFLDEPTTGLDPQSRARLWQEVRRLREEGTTVFLTTHYMDEADALCDRLAIMDHGEIVAEGSPAALKRQIAGDVLDIEFDEVENDGVREYAHALLEDETFVRELDPVEGGGLRLYVERGEVALPAVLRALDRAGLEVDEVSLSRPSLDDVFLKQTGRSLREAGQRESERSMT